MRNLRLLGMSLIAVLALGALTAGASWAKKALVLKEEGAPVAAGTELGVELELEPGRGEDHCILAWRGHMSLNSARDDKLTVEPMERECSKGVIPDTLSGRVNEVEMTGKRDGAAGGNIRISGSLRYFRQEQHAPSCTYEVTQLGGRLELPGYAHATVFARLRPVPSDPRFCHHAQKRTYLTVTVQGHNNKPLETELTG